MSTGKWTLDASGLVLLYLRHNGNEIAAIPISEGDYNWYWWSVKSGDALPDDLARITGRDLWKWEKKMDNVSHAEALLTMYAIAGKLGAKIIRRGEDEGA